ncbi:MAG: response regulator [Bacteroidales bacterium]|nr:response regulator [Bacteroidales bacterium]MCF8336515.1 response regulator [Bacteroidales bacterium]
MGEEESPGLEQRLEEKEKEITELKKHFLEEKKKLYHSNTMLLHNLSYDLRIPLNGILSMLEMFDRYTLTDQQKDQFRAIKDSVETLSQTVEDMMTFSALMSGTIEMKAEAFELPAFVDELKNQYELVARGKSIGWKISREDEMPQHVIGDKHHLRQILVNLLSNAFKNTREGEVVLYWQMLNQSGENLLMRWIVTDTGTGMSREKQQKIRERLQPTDDPNLLISEDVGVGLALAYYLTRKLNGSFDFESDGASGSRFYVDIPLKKHEETTTIEKHPYHSSTPKRLLLVEDNYLNQKFASAALQKAGHKLDIAENGKIAYQKYKQNDYDLILMDIELPLTDGIQVTKSIRKDEEKDQRGYTPIIAITAYAIEHDRVKCLNAGMDEYLTKPFRPEELLELIERMVT